MSVVLKSIKIIMEEKYSFNHIISFIIFQRLKFYYYSLHDKNKQLVYKVELIWRIYPELTEINQNVTIK